MSLAFHCFVSWTQCARGEFAFILALEAKTLGLLTEPQYASLVLPVLLAAVAAPFGLSASINFANRQGLANIDEAEDATSALNKAHNIYYQMHLRCKNSWGLVQGILHEATARDLEVIDVRITTAGKDADDVFYVCLAYGSVLPPLWWADGILRHCRCGFVVATFGLSGDERLWAVCRDLLLLLVSSIS